MFRLLVGWLAVAAVAYLAFVLLRRAVRFFARLVKQEPAPVPANVLHEELFDLAEDVAATTRIAAVIAGGAAFVAAPTGLMSLGVAMGFVRAPFIVTIAPLLFVVAAGATAVYAAATMYVKKQRTELASQARTVPRADA